MNILQFQITNQTEEEEQIIPQFCEWFCDTMYSKINTKMNRIKIQKRINYLLEVDWIRWTNKKQLDIDTIMDTIHKSLTYTIHRNNVVNIITANNIYIPNTITSSDRLIRFLNYGDGVDKGISLFTNILRYYTYSNIQTYWTLYVLDTLGYNTNARILTR